MYYVHGLSYEPLFNVLHMMHYRCENESHPQYKDYGGRGITVCDQWSMDKAQNFINWAKNNGWQPGKQIDRIDNDKGYNPQNCRIVTRSQNCRNTRNNVYVIVNNEQMLLCQAIQKYCVVSKKQFQRRYYHRKWPLEKALFQIPQKRNQIN